VGQFLNFSYQRFFKKEDVPQKEFLEEVFLISKKIYKFSLWKTCG
jgi:hypothetical protein